MIATAMNASRGLHLFEAADTRVPDLSFAQTPAHKQFRDRVRQLVVRDVLPHLDRWEESETLPRELFAACGAAGITGHLVPRALGGGELDYSYSVAAAEELMRHGATSVAVSILLQSNTVCPLLTRWGSPRLQTEVLAPLAAGRTIAALGVTEPAGGSALLHTVECVAESDGDDWIVTGEKIYITNGPVADVVLALVRTSPAPGPFSMTLIAVPTDTLGFEVVRQFDKLGLRASPTGHLRFNRCRVPKRFTVGRAHYGYTQVSAVLAEERLLIAIGAVAAARECIDRTVVHLRELAGARTAEALAELATLAADTAACRAFAYAAAAEICAGQGVAAASALAKFAVCERVQRVIMRCAELHGAAAAREGHWAERAVRDARALTVFAGSSESMREILAAKLIPSTAATSPLTQGLPS